MLTTKFDYNANGTQVTDETHLLVGASSFSLNHDTFLGGANMVIRTAGLGGGTLLVENTHYTLGGIDDALTGVVGANVYTTVTIIDAAYQSCGLYFSYKTIGDYAEAGDINDLQNQIKGKADSNHLHFYEPVTELSSLTNGFDDAKEWGIFYVNDGTTSILNEPYTNFKGYCCNTGRSNTVITQWAITYNGLIYTRTKWFFDAWSSWVLYSTADHNHNSTYYTKTELGSTTDGSSGADKIGATAITGVTGTKVQTQLESIKTLIDGKAASSHTHDDRYYTETELGATTDGSSGANKIGSTAITGISGTTVQAQIESMKSYIDGKNPVSNIDYIHQNQDGTYGGKITPNSGLSVNISPFASNIGGEYQELLTSTPCALAANKASLIYGTKGSGTTPTIARYDAAYPEPDDSTVAQWRLNATGNIPNYAVGKNAIAVTNNLVSSGTLTRVDGWCDYGMQTDGSTGSYTSANNTGFPTGTQEREIDILYTAVVDSTRRMLISNAIDTSIFGIEITASNNVRVWYGGSLLDTGYLLEEGKTYFISICTDGTTVKAYINSILVLSSTTVASATGNIYLFQSASGTGNNAGKGTIQFVELRNKIRTPAQIAAISNKLCFPVRYEAWLSSYPADPTDTGYHCWDFDDPTNATCWDRNPTSPMNGAPSGTTVVDSEIGLGKARRFNGTSDFIGLGTFAFPSEFTVLTVVCCPSTGSYLTILGNYNGTNGNQFTLSQSGNGKIALWNQTEGWVYGDSFVIGRPTFIGWVQKNGKATLFSDSPYSGVKVAFNPYRASATNLQMGQTGITSSNQYFSGVMEYMVFVPRALSQSEIAQYYNTLMKREERTVVNDCLPDNSISLGFTRTNSSKVIELDGSSYKYMRNEGATKTEGNKQVFLGWQYYSAASTKLSWKVRDTFGGIPVKLYYVFSKSADHSQEVPVQFEWYNSSNSAGIINFPTTSDPSRIQTGNLGPYMDGTTQASGYIGCYAEVL